MAKKKEMSIDELAMMVKKGFDHADDRMNDKFAKIDERLDRIEFVQREIRQDLSFRVHKFELKELEYRVEKLEKKFAK